MGNEMGNNNVIGQQESEQSAKDVDKTMDRSDCSPGFKNINDKEKDDAKDVDMSEVLKIPLISIGGDEKMASDQTKKTASNEDLDEKNRGSLQDHTSTQDGHGNSNLYTEEGDETQDSETEIITNFTEAVAPVGSATEDMTSNKDTSSCDEQLKQLVHESVEESEEITLENSPTFLEENIESLPKDEEESCSQVVAVVGANLDGEDTVENLEGETGVPTVYDLSTPSSVQGETKSSTEPILTDYRDAEIKEVFIQDETGERGDPSHVRPEDDTKQETSKIADFSRTNGKEFQKHELSIAAAEQMPDSVSAAAEHNVIEITENEQGGTADKDVADKNEADNFEGADGIHDFAGIVKVHGEDFTGLGPPLSGHIPICNKEKVQEGVIIEELAALMTATSSALQRVEDSVKEHRKPTSSDSNQGTTISTYEVKTMDSQEIMNKSQRDEPQQVLLEEREVVKFENSETLSTCKQLLECSPATESIFVNVFNKEYEGASDNATCFASESNEQKVTGTVSFAAEFREKKVIADADKSSEEQCPLQEPTIGRDAGEETPLLMSSESINSSSYSSEQHIKVVNLMQAKDEVVEESEKSPLLSPREPSEGAFRVSNQSARNNKPLHSLMTEDRVGMWSRLKEQETAPKNSSTVSSPRSKEKQKPKSSLFAICMCCTAATN